MDSTTIFNTLAGTFPVLLAILAFAPVTRLELAVFRSRQSLPARIAAPTLPRAIARSRGYRLLGLALGLAAPPLVRAASGESSIPPGSALLWGAGGYLVGAFLAAMGPVAAGDEPRRAATLVPRQARKYLSRRALVLPGVTVGLSLIVAVFYLVGPRRPDGPSSGTLLGAVALSVLAGAVMMVGTRWVVRRPQPVPDDDALTVDDAVRAHGLHLLVGTANAIGAAGASAACFALGRATDVDAVARVMPWIGTAAILVALSAWDGEVWRHRRARAAP